MAPRGTIARPSAAKRWSRDQFVNSVRKYLLNKATIDMVTFENQGDKKKEIPGLRDNLLDVVKANGEMDPESGSFFLRLEEPVVIGTNQVNVVKAEARGYGKKHLDVDKAIGILKAVSESVNEDLDDESTIDLVEECTRYRVTLPLMDKVTYDKFIAALKKGKVDIEPDDVADLLDEESVLNLHFEDRLEEADLDAMYEPDPIVWALTFQS